MQCSSLRPVVTLALSLAIVLPVSAADFFLTSLVEAQKASKSSGKPIFLDAFTTWCAPCKQMDAEVFSQPEIQEQLNRDFVPLRLDMEQPEGRSLGQRFKIAGYPTLLVFDAKGELHRATGFLAAAELTAFAKTSLNSADNYRHWRNQYLKGARDTALLDDLAAYAKTAVLPEGAQYQYDLLKLSGDWSSEAASLALLEAPQDLSTPLFDSLVARRAQVGQVFGAPLVDERIARLVDDALFGALATKPKAARRLIARAYPGKVDSTYLRYQMRRAREAGEAKAFGKYAIESQARFPSHSADELAELIYVFEERLPGWKVAQVEFWRKREKELRAAE